MSATVQAKGVGAGFGDRELFSGVDLVVAPGDVVGLVGPNGAGKSTLMQVLAGRRAPDAGSVSLSPPHAQVGYLAQEIERLEGETVRAHLERRTGVAPAQTALDAAADDLAAGGAGSEDGYAEALERWLALGGADFDARMGTTVDDLDLGVDLDLPMTALSGGEAARVGLAALILSRYDVYLLDEPTNDLDADGLARLEDFVARSTAPIVVVSHDREFLSRTVTSVVEIDRSLQRVLTYGGTYDAYLEERSIARRRAREAYEGYATRRDALQARARRQRAWMAKGVRNARRKATDNDKFIPAFRADSAEKQAAKARQTERLIDRLEVVDEPRKEWQLQLSIAAAPRSGAVVAVARNAVVERGDFRLGPVDLQVDWQDRVAVTGPNGSGKSTLLGLLLGRITPSTGTVDLGRGVLVGEVDQARRAFEGDEALATAFSREVPDWPTSDVRTLLAKFGLGTHHIDRPARSQSPGERTRAALALLQARGVNLLVLDEPTNHLDLPAIEQLEAALDTFDGTILLVTHDRRMLETVRLTRRLHVEDGVVTEVTPD
ncbi:ABC-F family ATP-binding cassette domain-containing protein [Actinotalea subterranea]|uniref:ABC-F family ATP-binding cassette domain-containing protein n=1 Tax=Actinotalea subterranea TaxID=2607497 RepID=UPI0011ECC7CB|nr:ABC-F family ATP-binding cassette domain-containing protein [Actinotalea subterranea]